MGIIKVKASGDSKTSSGLNSYESVSEDTKACIDSYATLGREIKDLQAERDQAAGVIKQEALQIWAANLINGKIENFKLEGNEETVTYQVQHRTKIIGQKEYDKFSNKLGKKAAENCLEIDYGSIKLNSKIFENPAHAKKVEAALEKLSKELGMEVISEAVYKIQDDFFNKLRASVKTTDQVLEAIETIGVTNFPQSK